MTITFPRDLPEPLNIRAPRFEPSYMQVRSPTRGGLVQVVNVGVDLWSARYETAPMREVEAESWKAWLHSLRRYALGYPNGYGGLNRAFGAGAFDGTANLSAIGTAKDTVTLTTLPVGFTLAPGDMLSFPVGTFQTLHRVIEGGAASNAGSLTLTVEPTVPLAATTSVTVTLVKPWCHGVLDPRSVSGPWQLGRVAAVSFDAMQVY